MKVLFTLLEFVFWSRYRYKTKCDFNCISIFSISSGFDKIFDFLIFFLILQKSSYRLSRKKLLEIFITFDRLFNINSSSSFYVSNWYPRDQEELNLLQIGTRKCYSSFPIEIRLSVLKSVSLVFRTSIKESHIRLFY